ncbi:hypothetical protein [Veillonella caviae]|uniref:hypothetical protein n=3 Tax=Veillonella caviae TaxID=248316 RepID=UPI002A910FED|nr:hypothetical protein [Veillonella caviae]
MEDSAFMLFDMDKEVQKGYKKRRGTSDLGVLGNIIRVIDYISSDQEAEGREYAIEFVDKLYEPVFRDLEYSIREMQMNAASQTLDFEQATAVLRLKYDEYLLEISRVEQEIQQLIEEDNELASFREVIGRLGTTHVISTIGLSDFSLDKKMEKKRREFFDIELRNQIRLKEEKFSELNKDFSQIFDQIEGVQEDERNTLSELQALVEEFEKKYLDKKLEYNLMKEALGY